MNHDKQKFKQLISRASLAPTDPVIDEDDGRIDSVEFMVIKEYIRAGGTYEKIAEHVGLPVETIKAVDETKYYIDWMKMEDQAVIEKILSEEV